MGVVHIYAEYCKKCDQPLPLWMVGDVPSPLLQDLANSVAPNGKIYFLSGLSNKQVQAAYSLAKAMIFPSLAEGFGWPIAEAMACGCPVLTTDQAPMTEVGGSAVTYISVMPHEVGVEQWADHSADILIELLNATEQRKLMHVASGLAQVALFNSDKAISAYEDIYHHVMAQFRPSID